MNKTLITGALGGILFVSGSAFGAHAFKNMLSPPQLATYHTAMNYIIIHSLAMLFVGLFELITGKLLNTLYLMWLAGVCLFSGSLILYVFTNITFLVYFTPIGGIFMISGWIYLLLLLLKYRN